MKATVLSTKTLKPNQRELLLNAGLGFVERDFISIKPLPFQVDELAPNIIFTSKNTVKIVLDNNLKERLTGKNIFCVGDKTAALLQERGLEVKEKANYGAELADIICENYNTESFHFFCGKKRRPELPERLSAANVELEQTIVYDTIPAPKKIHRIFEGVLFFSPSAVKSFCSKNSLKHSMAFCIGRSTASEAEKYTSNIKISNTTSIESVIVQVVKYFQQQENSTAQN